MVPIVAEIAAELGGLSHFYRFAVSEMKSTTEAQEGTEKNHKEENQTPADLHPPTAFFFMLFSVFFVPPW